MNNLQNLFLCLLLRFTNGIIVSTDHLNYVMYKTTYNEYRIIPGSTPEKIVKQDIFNTSLKTVFFIPGCNASIRNRNIKPIIKSYIRSKEYNLIHLDHFYYTWNVDNPALNEILLELGKIYGHMISKLIHFGLRLNSIEVVGHSFGACVTIVVANNTYQRLPLIVGLEAIQSVPFEKGYADYTIALHTNMGIVGDKYYNLADSDLIANNGLIQQACLDEYNCDEFKLELSKHRSLNFEVRKQLRGIVECSHVIAATYWGYMVEHPELFYGVKYNSTDCNNQNCIQLGPNLRTPGTLYFKTSNSAPYGLGGEGCNNIKPVNNTLMNYYSAVWSNLNN